MRCSVSPFARASAVCMLMQLAQPLICEARIFTSSARLGSRLEAMATEAPNPGLHQRRGRGEEIDFGSHDRFPSVGSDIMTRQDLPV